MLTWLQDGNLKEHYISTALHSTISTRMLMSSSMKEPPGNFKPVFPPFIKTQRSEDSMEN